VPASSRRWLVAAMGVVLAIAACVYAFKATENASAILRWRDLIQSVARGENVYNEWTKGGSFPYPPFAGLVLWPLTLLPPLAAGLAWFFLKVAMAGWAIRWSIQLACDDERRFPLAAVVVLLILISRPMLSDLQHGNINVLILYLTTAGLVAFRKNHDWLAGLAIALGTSIKLTPALFIPYFAYKRQWRVVAWSLAGLVAFLFVVPGAVLGFERNWWLLRSWSGAMVEPYMLAGKVETLQMNQSLAGVWMRLVTDCPGVELEDGSTRPINVLSLGRTAAVWSLKGLTLGLLISIACLCRTPTFDRRDWRLACEYGLVFIAMLLISERSWKHHFVTMLLPYAAALAYIWRDTCNSKARTWIWGILAGAFCAMASTSAELAGWLADGNGHKYAQAYGLFCVSALLVFAVLSVILATAHAAASLTIGSESCDSR
jgi:hypothetical protein